MVLNQVNNDEMEGLTSSVFGHPFDVVGNALDVEVVAVESGALLFAEIRASGRTWLDVARPVAHRSTAIHTHTHTHKHSNIIFLNIN